MMGWMVDRVAKARRSLLLAGVAGSVLTACGDDYGSSPVEDELPQATVATASGDIAGVVGAFRAALGEPANGGTPGEQPAGRREINWDGAAANPFNNRNDFPGDFFNTTVRTGAVFTTEGSGFRNDSLLFAELEPTNAAQFETFTPTKIFAPVGSPEMDVHFRVAGTSTPARVRGFGVALTDVDETGSAWIEPYDASGRSLGRFQAPVRAGSTGLSFVGVTFTDAVISRVRIRAGEAAVGAGVRDVSQGGQYDLVVLDNFLFAEPRSGS